MKKLFCTLWTALFLLSACSTAAYADAISPVGFLAVSVLPVILIGVAVIVAAVVIHRIRKKK